MNSRKKPQNYYLNKIFNNKMKNKMNKYLKKKKRMMELNILNLNHKLSIKHGYIAD